MGERSGSFSSNALQRDGSFDWFEVEKINNYKPMHLHTTLEIGVPGGLKYLSQKAVIKSHATKSRKIEQMIDGFSSSDWSKLDDILVNE
jgi:hypothetical protein